MVDAVRKAPPDIVLVEVDSYSGLSAVKTIQAVSPETKIIMICEENEKVSEYFRLHVGGFLKKPIEEEKLKEQLLRARHPFLAKIKNGSDPLISFRVQIYE